MVKPHTYYAQTSFLSQAIMIVTILIDIVLLKDTFLADRENNDNINQKEEVELCKLLKEICIDPKTNH
jgi:hypothetical protein